MKQLIVFSPRFMPFCYLLLGLSLASCSAAPHLATPAMDRAERTISKADQARVAQFAPAELSSARLKMQASRAALLNNNLKSADRLAFEATLDAELATARSELVQAQNINTEMSQSISILKQEMQRKRQPTKQSPRLPWHLINPTPGGIQ